MSSVVPVIRRRRRRGEEDDGAGDVHRLADPMQAGDPLDDVGLEGRVGEVGGGAVGPDERRGDGVDRDAVLPHSTARHVARWATAAFETQ